jgi:hypothetical protein
VDVIISISTYICLQAPTKMSCLLLSVYIIMAICKIARKIVKSRRYIPSCYLSANLMPKFHTLKIISSIFCQKT